MYSYSLKSWMVVPLLLLLFPVFSYRFEPYFSYNSSVNLYQSWSNNLNDYWYNERVILGGIINESTLLAFGFFKSSDDGGKKNSYLVIYLRLIYSTSPDVIWSPNRDKPVGENSALHFTAKGGLELEDEDGSLIWSTNTSGLVATRLNLTSDGNLMLLDDKDKVIWQSFDYPTDTWLPNQNICSSKRLLSSNSSSNLASGLFSLSVDPENDLSAFTNTYPPQKYVSYTDFFFDNYVYMNKPNNVVCRFDTETKQFKYIRLEPNGHLYLYTFPTSTSTLTKQSLFENLDECDYPTTCGNYGVCSDNGACSCPGESSSYFTQLQEWQPNLRCKPVTVLSCEKKNLHSFLELKNVSYFNLEPFYPTRDVESCKRACLDNCTCKAAFFSSRGCSLQSQLFSLKHDSSSDSVAFIKVQHKRKLSLVAILLSTLSVAVVIVLVISCYCYKILINSKNNNEEEGDDQVILPLKRFSFLELESATRNFQVKLGQGGFGSVFEGDLSDGTKVAVKRLDSIGQGRKEFLAEVNTIGSIHHFNLVKLIGYCAGKSSRLLVYEHMSNGSLDKWIFRPDSSRNLVWEIRKKIIIALAKGLEYLHGQCNPNIIHFDIKPQNILLDEDFNIKISDFGLAKLIDRDQSQVITVLKGTPRYLAPELFSGTNISAKADVFSFGVVILEIIFGRKNLGPSLSCLLVNVVKEKAEKNQVLDLVDEYMEGTESEKEEAVKMIKIGMWCLQDHTRRPSISTVLKVLDGLAESESIVEFESLITTLNEGHVTANISAVSTNSAPPDASILSGPR